MASQPAPVRASMGAVALRLAASVALLSLAVFSARSSWAYLQSERLAGLGIAKSTAAKNPNVGRVDVRRAVTIDPRNAEAVLRLSNMIIQSETERAVGGRDADVSAESLAESLDLLARAQATYPVPSMIARQRAETADFLSQLYLRRGRTEDARAANQTAAEEFSRAIRLTPTLKIEDGQIYARALFANFRDGQNAVAAWYGRGAVRRGGYDAIDRRELSPALVGAQAAMGNIPAAMSELTRQYWRKPGDLRAIAQLELAAKEFGAVRTAQLAYAAMARRGTLTKDAAGSDERLRGLPKG